MPESKKSFITDKIRVEEEEMPPLIPTEAQFENADVFELVYDGPNVPNAY